MKPLFAAFGLALLFSANISAITTDEFVGIVQKKMGEQKESTDSLRALDIGIMVQPTRSPGRAQLSSGSTYSLSAGDFRPAFGLSVGGFHLADFGAGMGLSADIQTIFSVHDLKLFPYGSAAFEQLTVWSIVPTMGLGVDWAMPFASRRLSVGVIGRVGAVISYRSGLSTLIVGKELDTAPVMEASARLRYKFPGPVFLQTAYHYRTVAFQKTLLEVDPHQVSFTLGVSL